MNNQKLIIIAGGLLFLSWAKKQKAMQQANANRQTGLNNAGSILSGLGNVFGSIFGGSSSSSGGARAITNTATAGQIGAGWQYFTDGTSISPGGAYFKGGTQIWSPSPDSIVINSPYLDSYEYLSQIGLA